MATIGSLIVNVGANIAGFEKGMGGASKALKTFAEHIPVIGAAVGLAFEAIPEVAHKLKDALDDMAKVQKIANSLGTSRDFVEGMQLGMKELGQNADDLIPAFRHLQADIGEAGVAGSEAAKKFARFGIDAAKFKAGDLEGNLGKIADGINAIPDPAGRAAARLQLLGRHGMELGPILAGGSKALKELTDKAELLGDGVGEVQGQKILAATRAWKAGWVDAGHAIDSLWARMAAGLAGPMGDFGRGMTKVALTIGAMGRDAQRGFSIAAHGFDAQAAAEEEAKEKAADAAALKKRLAVEQDRIRQQDIQDTVKGLNEKYQQERAAIGKTAAEVDFLKAKQKGATDQQLAPLRALAAGNEVEKLSEKLQEEADAHTKVAHAADFARLARQGATSAMLAPLRAKAELTSFNDAMRSLNDSIAEQGFTAARVPEKLERWKAAQAGLTTAHQEEIEALARLKRQNTEAIQIFEATRTPLELFNRALDEQAFLLDRGADGWNLYARSIGKAAQELIAAADVAGVHLPTAALKDSSEAYSTLARSEAQQRGNNPAALLQRAMEQLASTAEKQRQLQEQMVSALRNPRYTVVTGK